LVLMEGIRRDKKTSEKLIGQDWGNDPCKAALFNRVDARYKNGIVELAKLLTKYGISITGSITEKVIGVDIYKDLQKVGGM